MIDLPLSTPTADVPPNIEDLLKRAQLSKLIQEAQAKGAESAPFGGMVVQGGAPMAPPIVGQTDVAPRPAAGVPYGPPENASPPPPMGGLTSAAAPPPPAQSPLQAFANPEDKRGLLTKLLNLPPAVGGVAQQLGPVFSAMAQHNPDSARIANSLDATTASNKTYDALIKAGAPPEIAKAAIGNPAILAQVLPQYLGPKNPTFTKLGPDDRLVKTDVQGQTADVTPGGAGPSTKTVQGRQQLASQYNLTPGTPEYQAWILNGKLPDTVPDHKAIAEADQKVLAAGHLTKDLKAALEFSKTAYSGLSARAAGPMNALGGTEGSRSAAQFDNLVQTSILPGLKSTFGARVTNVDVQLMKDLAGASTQPTEVREAILTRAIRRAEELQGEHKQVAAQLRGNTYYKPGGGVGAVAPAGAGGPDPLGLR